MKQAVVKITNLINFIVTIVLWAVIKLKKNKIQSGTLLLIRLDAIGDYMLFRNYIQALKQSKTYCNYKITLCGNVLWKDIALSFDKEYFDESIWIDRKKFSSSIGYKYRVLNDIYNKGFEVVIEPEYSREILFGDMITLASGTPKRIACSGVLDKHSKWKRNLLTDRIYSVLLPSSTNNLFEFLRNKEFFENLLNEKIDIQKPFFNNLGKSGKADEYMVMIPGAQDKKRMWDYNNFVKAAEYILNKYGCKIIVCGSKNESELAEKIVSMTGNKNISSMAGKTTLTEYVELIAGAKLVLTNDTSAVHIAVSAGVNFICISNGNHLGRFIPYPKEIYQNGYVLFPFDETQLKNNEINSFRFISELDINSIPVDKLIALIETKKLL